MSFDRAQEVSSAAELGSMPLPANSEKLQPPVGHDGYRKIQNYDIQRILGHWAGNIGHFVSCCACNAFEDTFVEERLRFEADRQKSVDSWRPWLKMQVLQRLSVL